MHDLFSNAQQIRKPAVVSKGGIVAAQSRKAAEVGAEVLAAGGDCVDAVIATTFALGVLEPWMSGVGGGGAMVLYRAREDRYEVIDYGMRAPRSLRPEDYPRFVPKETEKVSLVRIWCERDESLLLHRATIALNTATPRMPPS